VGGGLIKEIDTIARRPVRPEGREKGGKSLLVPPPRRGKRKNESPREGREPQPLWSPGRKKRGGGKRKNATPCFSSSTSCSQKEGREKKEDGKDIIPKSAPGLGSRLLFGEKRGKRGKMCGLIFTEERVRFNLVETERAIGEVCPSYT